MSLLTLRTIAIFITGIYLIAACSGNDNSNKTAVLEARDVLHFSEIGKIITKATFKALSTRLQHVVKAKGTANAIAYCNLVALPITDSMSILKQAEIRRTSLKLRNPKNNPTPWELEQLKSYQADFEEGKALSPVVKRLENGTVIYMEPILTMPFCLQCHGQPAPDVNKELQKLYPNDKAVAYKEGDLRGIWAVKLR